MEITKPWIEKKPRKLWKDENPAPTWLLAPKGERPINVGDRLSALEVVATAEEGQRRVRSRLDKNSEP